MCVKIIKKLFISALFISTLFFEQFVEGKTVVEPLIAAGGYYSLLLTEEGQVWQWGGNSTENSKVTPPKPHQITLPDNITAISAGRYFSLALDQKNQVWAWGSNSHGQLGNGDISYNDPAPAIVKNVTNVTMIKAGWFHSLALREDGTLWGWGQNEEGQLGDGTRITKVIATQVKNLTDVIQMASGRNHSLAITKDGTVWAWGGNESGQLGDGTYTSSNIPVRVKNITNITIVAATRNHSLALTKDGTIWAWGNNTLGELGNDDMMNSNIPVQIEELEDIITISADGWNHSLAVTSEGEVWAWGSNQYGKLGDGTEENRYTPIKVQNIGNITAVATGWGHSLALTKTQQVWGWGSNEREQLGNPNISDYSVLPVLMQDIVLTSPIRCEVNCEEGKFCVCFNTEQTHYQIGEQLQLSLKVDINETSSETALDLYVVLGLLFNNEPFFLFLTPEKTFAQTATPFDSVEKLSQSEELGLLNIPVENCMGGDYTLYAAFVEKGKTPEVKNIVSNLAVYHLTLEDICANTHENE